MPFGYKFLPGPNCALFRWDEKIEPTSLREALDVLVEEPLRQPDLKILADLRRVLVQPTVEELRRFAALVKERDSVLGTKRAASIVNNENLFGLLRIYATHRNEKAEISKVFRGVDKAKEWVELDGWAGDPFAEAFWSNQGQLG